MSKFTQAENCLLCGKPLARMIDAPETELRAVLASTCAIHGPSVIDNLRAFIAEPGEEDQDVEDARALLTLLEGGS